MEMRAQVQSYVNQSELTTELLSRKSARLTWRKLLRLNVITFPAFDVTTSTDAFLRRQ